MTWESFINTFDTGSGFWNPLVWLTIMVIAFLVAYIIRSFGNKSFKETPEKVKPFLSGNKEGDKEGSHVKASNLYWGFMETFKGIYTTLTKMHTGDISDYVMWFVVILGIMFVVIVGVF